MKTLRAVTQTDAVQLARGAPDGGPRNRENFVARLSLFGLQVNLKRSPVEQQQERGARFLKLDFSVYYV